MVETLPLGDQVMLERMQRRRCMRLIVYMVVLTGLTVASQFMSLFGATVGAIPWWLAPITLALLGWAWITLQRVNAKLEVLEQRDSARETNDMADPEDVPT